MNRRAFVIGLGTALTAARGADAQSSAKKQVKIGWLAPHPPEPHSPEGQAFWQEMNRVGFVLNDNARLELAVSPAEEHPAAAADLVQRRVDVIITVGNMPTIAANKTTAIVPIVMVNVDDPVANGIVPDLRRPGGNVTGLTNMASPLAAKRVGLLKEALPFVTRIGILWNAASASNARVVRSLTNMSPTLGIEPHSIELRSGAQLRSAFTSMVSKRLHAFVVVAENLLWQLRNVVEAELAYKLPGTYPWPDNVRIGGLMSYSHDHVDVWRRAGAYVGRVLSGADVRELPIEEPTKFLFVVNLKTAKALGLTIPPSLLLRADEVIE